MIHIDSLKIYEILRELLFTWNFIVNDENQPKIRHIIDSRSLTRASFKRLFRIL